MKIYQVGGSVRDRLRGRQPQDYDYVVTGASPEEMLARGFVRVGKDFPVFLHPESKEEYALARKEIKTGCGHADFSFIFNPSVTLNGETSPATPSPLTRKRTNTLTLSTGGKTLKTAF